MQPQNFRHVPLAPQTFETPSDYGESLSLAEEQAEFEPRRTTNESNGKSIRVGIPPRPVYVTVDRDGESTLMYNSQIMREGERYPIRWNDEDLVLVKECDAIVFYKRQV